MITAEQLSEILPETDAEKAWELEEITRIETTRNILDTLREFGMTEAAEIVRANHIH